MKVTCDKCGASYKIPDEKLTKEVNKATCKKCGHRIVIKRDAESREQADFPLMGLSETDGQIAQDEKTIITVPTELQGLEPSTPLMAGGLLNPLDLERRQQAAVPSPRPASSPRIQVEATPAQGSTNEAGRLSGTYQPVGPAAGRNGEAAVGGTMAAASSGRDSAMSKTEVQGGSTQPSGPAIAGTGGNRANVAAIFVQNQEAREAEAQTSVPPSPIPTVFMLIALAGLLPFLVEGIWKVQPLTAIGYSLAVYGLGAGLMVHQDFVKGGQVNVPRAFGVPLIPALLLIGYWMATSGAPTPGEGEAEAPAEAAPAGEPAPAGAAPAEPAPAAPADGAGAAGQ